LKGVAFKVFWLFLQENNKRKTKINKLIFFFFFLFLMLVRSRNGQRGKERRGKKEEEEKNEIPKKEEAPAKESGRWPQKKRRESPKESKEKGRKEREREKRGVRKPLKIKSILPKESQEPKEARGGDYLQRQQKENEERKQLDDSGSLSGSCHRFQRLFGCITQLLEHYPENLAHGSFIRILFRAHCVFLVEGIEEFVQQEPFADLRRPDRKPTIFNVIR
jgi:hypothetical protein